MLRLKRQLRRLRARVSIPGLLAASSERSVISLVSGLNAGCAIFTISLIAWLIDLPLLFPALGPTAFVLFSQPFSPAAAPRSVILGHGAAILTGWASWLLVNSVCHDPVTLTMQGWPPLISASVALAVCCILLVRLGCPHAPACASALIVALGAASSPVALIGMAVGVMALTAQAVVVSRVVGVNVPLWFPRRTMLESAL